MSPTDEVRTQASRAGARGSPAPAALTLTLLGTFHLHGEHGDVALSFAGQRLVAYLALRQGATRAKLAGLLWPEVNEQRALGNLRSAIWRVHRSAPGLLRVADGSIAIRPGVSLDVRDMLRRTRALLADPAQLALDDLYSESEQDELLPGWYDDWVLLERERLRQLRLHALEHAAHELSRRGHHGRALDAALCAVTLEPLRETAHLAVLCIHLAEGNVSEAVAHYDDYCRLLRVELGIAPSDQLTELLCGRTAVAARDVVLARRHGMHQIPHQTTAARR